MAATAVTIERFWTALRSSGLLTAQELDAARSAVRFDDCDAAPALAAALIRHGSLTTFQARKLLAGISRGLVVGNYRILAPLGKGGMGKVYLARDARHDVPIALKVLPPHWAREEERLLMRFQREMEISKEVDHTHLARTFEAGVADDVHFIAMEYVPGKTLYRTVNTTGPLAPDIAARVFAEAADGLAHAHERGLIHRDLKPSNLMLTPAGHAKLLDLGLALRAGEEGDSAIIGGQGLVVGTMDYVAPEQTRNATNVDERSDLYGLGATLFFAITGRPPFPGGTSRDKIQRQRNEKPPRVEEYNYNVPEPFADLIDQLLSKEPGDRPKSAIEVQKKLKLWAAPPAPPDTAGDTQRILKAITSDPPSEIDGSDVMEPAKHHWSLWLILSGAVVLTAVLVLLTLALLNK